MKWAFVFLLGVVTTASGQTRVAFYNVENLFDTVATPGHRDAEFTPAGVKRWTAERYRAKLRGIAGVLREMEYPAVVGLAEVETFSAIADLCAAAGSLYTSVWFRSADPRGISVGLIYKDPFVFARASVRRSVLGRTRPILLVEGSLAGRDVSILVSHWPSRVGAGSAPKRAAVARQVRGLVDSLHRTGRLVIAMGDWNDDPTDESVAVVLGAGLRDTCLLRNPFRTLLRRGFGSLGYADQWNLFDQIAVSPALWPVRAAIHRPPRLLQRTGRFRGYPARTYAGSRYLGGVSDHLAVYIELKMENSD